jgi:hypothetical protein
MHRTAILQPTDLVWLPMLDTGTPEPPPPGARGVRAVSLGRHACSEDIGRTVVVEDQGGFAPLTRRVHVHGDVDEGWDWGWRGSAPLDTALNLLLLFVHPRAAWRLQWAFCDAFLHPLPPAGGLLQGDEVRAWLRRNAWIGKQRSWALAEEAGRNARVAQDRQRSRELSPATRAVQIADLVACGTGAAPGTAEDPLAQAAALLDGSPPDQRWATLALIAGRLPPEGSPSRDTWRRIASPVTPGLPEPDTIAAVASVWSRLVGRPATERAEIMASAIRANAGAAGLDWRSVPVLSFVAGSGDPGVTQRNLCLAGDPVAASATLHALTAALNADAGLRGAATRIGLSLDTVAECRRAAHAAHSDYLRGERRNAESGASEEMQRVQAAEAARLPRGRSRRPPPASDTLRRWALTSPLALVTELARAGRGSAGPPALRAALEACGISFPDPAGTVAATLTWYAEERNPAALDAPVFLIRGDGLARTPELGHTGAATTDRGCVTAPHTA